MLRPGEAVQASGKLTVKADGSLQLDGKSLAEAFKAANGPLKSQRVIITIQADVTEPAEDTEPLFTPETEPGEAPSGKR